MSKKVSDENREDILVRALLTCPNLSEVAKKTRIGRSTIYEIMKKDSFQEKLEDARHKAVEETVAYMQGNLSECAQVLMSIVRDEGVSPQVRVNAINAMFMNIRGLSSEIGFSGMVVKINDSI